MRFFVKGFHSSNIILPISRKTPSREIFFHVPFRILTPVAFPVYDEDR